jgi:NAD dependent epimerase/dehydratase family enzyme
VLALEGQRVVPARLSELGFGWEYRTVEAALAVIVSPRNHRSGR